MRSLTSFLQICTLMCLVLCITACADGLNDSDLTSGSVSSKSDELSSPTSDPTLFSFLGDGNFGGMRLISGANDYNCVGYPVSDRALITLTECVEACSRDELCDIAVMSEGVEPRYFGLVKQMRIVPSPFWGEADDRLTLVEVESPQIWPIFSISTSVSAPFSYEGYKTVLASTETTVTVSANTCDPSSHGLFNQYKELVGLSSMSSSCDQYLALGSWNSSISEAIRGAGESLPRNTTSTEVVVEEPAEDPVEQEQTSNEDRWQAEVDEALSRAPVGCFDRETYCDGDVEMRCSNGSYTAFNCGQVGWACSDDSSFGAGCVPAE